MSAADQTNELLMTGLRLIEGVSLQALEWLWPGYTEQRAPQVKSLVQKGWLMAESDRLIIPLSARFLCDAITVELMVD
ncbi:MAG: hypothetical protein ACKOI1_06540 [Bacteroidota bacterium]